MWGLTRKTLCSSIINVQVRPRTGLLFFQKITSVASIFFENPPQIYRLFAKFNKNNP
jgi:hypothetical protein